MHYIFNLNVSVPYCPTTRTTALTMWSCLYVYMYWPTLNLNKLLDIFSLTS